MVGNGATLLLPGGLKANAARLALGAGSQVLYNELTGTGPQPRDGLTGLLRNAAGGTLELSGGRSLTVTGTFVNQGVLALGAGSHAQRRRLHARPRARSCARRSPRRPSGRVAVDRRGAAGGPAGRRRPGRRGGDIAVVTGAVAGTFGAVTGELPPDLRRGRA